MIGFAQMVVLATGGMNLSVGSIGVCAVMMGGALMQTFGLPVPVAIGGALALGAALGWLNGFVITRTGVNSFIITLASANLYSGGMLILTKALPLNNLPPEVRAFGKERVLGFPCSPLLIIALRDRRRSLRPLPLFRARPPHSRRRRQCARRGHVGRPGRRAIITISHVLSGLLAAIAGMMVVARLGAAMPAVGGEDWLLPSFLGPVLGGTLLSGGSVAVVGTVLGALLVTTIRSGLLVLQVGNFWLQLYLGLILLFAVLIERYRAVTPSAAGVARS